MFNDFKTTVLMCAVLIMAAMLAISSLGMLSLKAKNATLASDLTQSQVSVDALLRSNDNKDERIKALERDYRVITELNASHRNQIIDLKATHESRIDKANQMGNSDHEPTKTWANADLPSDALQLLKQTDCQGSDPNQHGLCATAN